MINHLNDKCDPNWEWLFHQDSVQLLYHSFSEALRMNQPTVIALNLNFVTRNPNIMVVKLDATMTIGKLGNRLKNILIQFNLPYGRLAFHQRGRPLHHQEKLGQLPQGTITCFIKCVDLLPIQELSTPSVLCIFCGQQYISNGNVYCSQCNGELWASYNM